MRNVGTGAETQRALRRPGAGAGAVAVRPPVPGIDLPGVFTLRNLEDTDHIHEWLAHRKSRRAVVVGGGYIGLEMVENLHRRGIEVTVLERLDQVMPPMDPEMVAPVHDELRGHGVDLRLATPLAAIEPAAKDRLGELGRGRRQDGERIAAGMVIVAVGVKPDVELARRAGLDIGALGGIVVDARCGPPIRPSGPWATRWRCRTSSPGNYALVPLAGPAARQGRIAADSICGRPARYRGTPGHRRGRASSG